MAGTLNNIASIHYDRGDWDQALGYLEQALQTRREIGNRAGESLNLYNMAKMYEALSDFGRAAELLEQAIRIREDIGHPETPQDRLVLEALRRKLET